MDPHQNLLYVRPTLLPAEGDDAVSAALTAGASAEQAAAEHPSVSRGWAELADHAWSQGHAVESYAYARVGYHRGLDALRRSGWKGAGPVPWEHEANRGFLRCVFALGRAADAISEDDEAERCASFLHECDPTAGPALAGLAGSGD